MRQAEVYRDGALAGVLKEEDRISFIFQYNENYFANKDKPDVSLTLPKTQKDYRSKFLFPAFSNLLSEGANRKVQSRLLNIDEDDDFGILLATARYDTDEQ
ncbi:HipA N-terminal domain-containing protein [soil metagenome]